MIREFYHIDLRNRNSFRVAQRATRLVEFETIEDLRLFFASGIPEHWMVLRDRKSVV